jgi:NADP-dependent 3-hydroxy acid dehydrogenase YdfG
MRSAGKGEVYGLVADQSKTEDLKLVFDEVDRRLGGLDILINNAAIAAASAEETPLADIRYVLETNLIGLIQCTHLAIAKFKDKGRGQIVNIGSMSDSSRDSGTDVYVATKAGVNGFSESLRKQVNKLGIRVILVEPGLVGTDMTASEHPPEEQPSEIEEGTMLKAEDIAESVHFALVQPERCHIISMQVRPANEED